MGLNTPRRWTLSANRMSGPQLRGNESVEVVEVAEDRLREAAFQVVETFDADALDLLDEPMAELRAALKEG